MSGWVEAAEPFVKFFEARTRGEGDDETIIASVNLGPEIPSMGLPARCDLTFGDFRRLVEAYEAAVTKEEIRT